MGRSTALIDLEARICAAGYIEDQSVADLRTLVCSSGTPVNRATVQALFRMKNATLKGVNSPDWVVFFVEVVGGFLQAHTPATHLPASDTGWRRRQIAANPVLDHFEKALLAYLADEGLSADWQHAVG